MEDDFKWQISGTKMAVLAYFHKHGYDKKKFEEEAASKLL